jgi:hypothetical protein
MHVVHHRRRSSAEVSPEEPLTGRVNVHTNPTTV